MDIKLETKSEGKIEIKYDYQLSKIELNQLFHIYNDVFYHNRVRKKDLVKQVKQQLGRSKIFQWFLLREAGRLVAIGSFVYDYSSLSDPKLPKFDINDKLNENICNIAVHEDYRRRGYATRIMEKIIEEHTQKDLTLEVKKDSPIRQDLVDFYQKLGFQRLSETGQGIYFRRQAK